MKTNHLLFCTVGLTLLSCTPRLYSKENISYQITAAAYADTIRRPPAKLPTDSFIETEHWLGTTNFNLRKPNLVIIHHTAQNSCEQTFSTFRMARTQVSAHYVICRDGKVQHMLNDYLRAWHAGNSLWGNIADVNSCSLGIELDNNGSEPFADAQINSLIALLGIIKKEYDIPTPDFLGHSDIAPGRKVDPSAYFPWKKLADAGFGYWYDDTTNVQVPVDFDTKAALRIIGYSVKNLPATYEAFRLHFEQRPNDTSELNDADKKILYTLYPKYL